MRNLDQMNLVKDINVDGGNVAIKLHGAGLNEAMRDWIKGEIVSVVGKTPDISDIKTDFEENAPKEINKITNVIPIMSGKGGVGKSLVTGLLAVALRRKGYSVGILDADITGPSVPKMFGVNDRPAGNDIGILPVSSKTGISIISINLLLPNADDAVIWRGPLIGKAITQFWEEVVWGKLDYLLVDLPPGTADAPLTVMQVLPVSGSVIVFTPQDLTTMIVRKAVQMVRQMKKPIAGIVENMSYLYVPEIDKKIELFGKSHADEMAESTQAALLGAIPIDPKLAELCDKGAIEDYDSDVIETLGNSFLESIKKISG